MTEQEQAAAAITSSGRAFVPQVVWVKGFKGQVTDGRIGRPSIEYAPLDWLPQAKAEQIRKIMEGAKQ